MLWARTFPSSLYRLSPETNPWASPEDRMRESSCLQVQLLLLLGEWRSGGAGYEC